MTPQPAKSAPQRVILEGGHVRLEPLERRHAEQLFAVSTLPGGPERYRYLPSEPPQRLEDLEQRIEAAQGGPDAYVAVVDKKTGTVLGQQAWLRIRPEHGSIEIGAIYWGLPMARTPLSTEAFYLFARHAFDDLGYRRFEWKCNNGNEPSKAAAARFGFTFEGVFRQDMIVKGESRDTAWFSILDSEWPSLRAEFERWLAPDNFDAEGRQKSRLTTRPR
ncbi:Protein N-acetyltransferase, RimJ/RimL family [Devosia lucknowensis]|uniref:Protein N-acetyltransferase, RimJ/RimL family n=1 Tax=Devosia lucknowensis TaxID=1096929 RepID=A0A1Y6G6Q5_9HYPH|nr:GNAT family protein [Devosia lucknowensis]SMQ85776.1 Protein N-acetyltransferase, RimJ/RimL family [Devosia lucknowensis]